MSDYHVVLGVLATLIGIVSYVPYFRDIFSGITKPHPFSWIAWGLLVGVAFVAHVVEGAGPGAWASGITAICCFAIGLLAFWNGEKEITRLDWVCFVSSLVAIALWRFVGDALTAVVIVTVADALAFVPTFRKSFAKPHEETLITYSLSIPKWIFGIAAVQVFNLTTLFFPVAIFLMTSSFVGMVLLRRRQLARIPQI